MEFEKKFPILGDYFLIKSLGAGLNSKVKLGYNKQDGKYYAIKIMKSKGKINLNQKAINNEVSIMSHLQHPHLIQLVKPQTQDKILKPNGKEKEVLYIVLEYAMGGELFDYVANTGNFSERIVRYFFKQVIEAIDYLHRQNFTHRDLKPENILIDNEFNLKLADFGFTTVLGGHDGLGKLRTQLGTESYMAPEINLKLTYSGVAIDLFALGIILFVMYSGNPPFNRADPKDIYFKQLCTNKHQIFWDAHLKFKDSKNFYTEGFINVVNSLLAFDPTQRMSLAELKMHPWINSNDIATKEEVLQEMNQRKQKLNIIKEKNRVQKELAKEQQQQKQIKNHDGISIGFQNFRSTDNLGNEFSLIKSKYPKLDAERNLYEYFETEEIESNLNNVFSNLTPKYLFNSLIKYCDQKYNLVNMHENMMKGNIISVSQEINSLKEFVNSV